MFLIFIKWLFIFIILLKDFNSISVREKGAVQLIEEHLGIKPHFVLDPTLLIDKKYYLNLIKNYKGDFQSENYIFIYTVLNLEQVSSYVRQINKNYNYKILWVKEGIEDFIFGIYYLKYHFHFYQK